MRILVTNDDSIDAHGLEVLIRVARHLTSDVWVMAPHVDNSGASHSLTLKAPLRVTQRGERMFSIHGTPTDCVIMGVKALIEGAGPDLVLSGINHGQNIADDVTYSGTIAGAIEGMMLGIPSLALSLVTGIKAPGSEHWETAEALAPALIDDLLKAGWPEDVLLNINFPDCGVSDVQGRMITTQGKRDPGLLTIDTRQDPWGNDYHWFNFERRRSRPDKGSDLWAAYHDFISITPLHLDLTHSATHDDLAAKLGAAF